MGNRVFAYFAFVCNSMNGYLFNYPIFGVGSKLNLLFLQGVIEMENSHYNYIWSIGKKDAVIVA